MSKLIKEELTKRINSEVLIFLKNGFRYSCKVLAIDEEHVKVLDLRKKQEIVLSIDMIAEVRVHEI